ncbi:hypothetical protein C0992_005261 [Termitomyces sp. T32_za158]|nr:hypothetical protein C0992_005261 [Termitomyces sp. T32_za158]
MGAISRRQEGIGTTDSHLNKSITYAFPYIDFPVLQSRIQPHFAIFNLVEKILLFEKEKYVDVEDCDELGDYFDVHRRFKIPLTYCRELHNRWLLPVPVDFLASLESTVDDVKTGTTISPDLARSLEDETAGLLPEESVSWIIDEEREDTDEEQDVSVDEETDAAFRERMKRWIRDVHTPSIQ